MGLLKMSFENLRDPNNYRDGVKAGGEEKNY